MRDIINLLEEIQPRQMTLWHGGRNLEFDYRDVLSHDKGRWEHGPGLYLTTHRATAERYAKGGRKLYRVTVSEGRDIDDVLIPLQDMIDFVNQNIKGAKKSQIISDLRAIEQRRGTGMIMAEVIVNLCLNWSAIANSKTSILRQFLIDHGVDYALVKNFGGRRGDTVMVVMNPKIIQKVEIVSPNTARDDEVPFEFK